MLDNAAPTVSLFARRSAYCCGAKCTAVKTRDATAAGDFIRTSVQSCLGRGKRIESLKKVYMLAKLTSVNY